VIITKKQLVLWFHFWFHAGTPRLYMAVIIGAAAGTLVYHLRTATILACEASGYRADRYLEYCQAEGYGDYDHGAFWFGLEPPTGDYVRKAEVLFIGNSRMQFGFSTAATADWFRSRSAQYYLLGFAYSEKQPFFEELLRKLRPQAKAYVVNIDRFFEPTVSEPARLVMHDGGALTHYRNKRAWQMIHQPVCSMAPVFCGHEFSVFRVRQTGVWAGAGGNFAGSPVSDDGVVDHDLVQKQAEYGRDFLLRLPVKRECVLLMLVPTTGTQRALARAVAAELGMPLFTPPLEGLRTFDGSHLDRSSAERWSKAFFDFEGSRLEACLSEPAQFEK
jgi:hypothetical protein